MVQLFRVFASPGLIVFLGCRSVEGFKVLKFRIQGLGMRLKSCRLNRV